MRHEPVWNLNCPMPFGQQGIVQLAHGGGGRWMHRLLEELILPTLDNSYLKQRHDSAQLPPTELAGRRIAFTTDSYVVRPLFFPGGDIGSLAVHGTINDLAMSGARPLWLSTGFILEEGLPIESLARICASMRKATHHSGVAIVTGDTKVVDRGKGDGIYINTAGLGVIEHDQVWAPSQVRPGDVILVSGDLGRHGIAIMAAREGIDLETSLESDSAPLFGMVQDLLQYSVEAHCLRDITRGGLVSALVEIAEASGTSMTVEEDALPVSTEVRVVCELLGFDPLHVACEGRFIAILPPQHAEAALNVLRAHPLGENARRIGVVRDGDAGMVILRNRLGTERVLDMLSGEQLPRIC